jgi:hypothetical protein
MTLLAGVLAATQGMTFKTRSGAPVHPAMIAFLVCGIVAWAIYLVS